MHVKACASNQAVHLLVNLLAINHKKSNLHQMPSTSARFARDVSPGQSRQLVVLESIASDCTASSNGIHRAKFQNTDCYFWTVFLSGLISAIHGQSMNLLEFPETILRDLGGMPLTPSPRINMRRRTERLSSRSSVQRAKTSLESSAFSSTKKAVILAMIRQTGFIERIGCPPG